MQPPPQAAKAAFSRFHELNAVLSDYDPQSELRRLCDTSSEGKPVRVSDDLWRVLVRAQELSERSDGAFDVTIGPVVQLWRSARQTKELPSPESLQAALARVGYRCVRLDPSSRPWNCSGRRCDWTSAESPRATPSTRR